MPKQLTPEEREIIRETERLGAEQAEKDAGTKGKGAAWKSGLTFAVIFFILVFAGYMVLRWVN